MSRINPDPYIAVYAVIVFLVPWVIYGSFIVRGLTYALSKGIRLFSWTSSVDIRVLRETDSYAACLHRRTLRWLLKMGVIWFLGFAVLCLTLYILNRRGVV